MEEGRAAVLPNRKTCSVNPVFSLSGEGNFFFFSLYPYSPGPFLPVNSSINIWGWKEFLKKKKKAEPAFSKARGDMAVTIMSRERLVPECRKELRNPMGSDRSE